MTAKPELDAPEAPEAACAECGWSGACPAVARCPECSSRQIRRHRELHRLAAELTVYEEQTPPGRYVSVPRALVSAILRACGRI